MSEKQNNSIGISSKYLELRRNVLEYTNDDMNLILNNDYQVYIALFDIPIKSNIIGFQTQTLALVFGLNAHIYHGSGNAIVDLEKKPNVMKSMQSLLISSGQVLSKMQLTNDIEFFNSKYVRAYLKTSKGIYFKELKGEIKEDKFLLMLLNDVLENINKTEPQTL